MRTGVQMQQRQEQLDELIGGVSGESDDPALWFVIGYREAVSEALVRPEAEVRSRLLLDQEVLADALRGFAGAAVERLDYITLELTDLEEVPEADSDPDVNFVYGRAAALAWVLEGA